MIGKNWMKALAVAGAAVGIAMPAVSGASTHYTGKTPASIAMMAADTGMSVSTVSTLHKHKSKHRVAHHSAVKKTASKSKHLLRKKHASLTVKKKQAN